MCEIYLKLTKKHKNDAFAFDLVSLLLTRNKFQTFFQCFCCWLWTGKCLLGSVLKIFFGCLFDWSQILYFDHFHSLAVRDWWHHLKDLPYSNVWNMDLYVWLCDNVIKKHSYIRSLKVMSSSVGFFSILDNFFLLFQALLFIFAPHYFQFLLTWSV